MSDKLETSYAMSHPEPGEEIFITGLAGYFPDSNSVVELQENLFNKVNLVTRDDRRWKIFDTEIPQEIGKISNIEKFDAPFFELDFEIAHYTDPMTRLLLERTYEAIIDAGMNPMEFHGTRSGVFVGCCFFESERKLLYEKLHCNNHGLIGSSQSHLACRISQWLGVTGPSYNVDTACSSSTYAFEQAFKAIRSGICDSAIVCGVNLCVHPFLSLLFSRMGILSPDGKCKTFDASANGYARSEAAVVCILQKAKDSRRAYAQVMYAKTNCDGFKDNGITYPAGNMQKCLLKSFYEECDISPNTVEYIEAHGTGTAVGDPEELNAIDNVMCKERTEPLLVGSVKSNLGHTEGASGLCSTAKICIAYHSGYIPPNIHYNEPRAGIPALVEGRIKVITEKQAWNRGLAGFSGFGFGGANAHILLKNFSKTKVNKGLPTDDLPRLVCVSGRSKLAVDEILNSLEDKSVDTEEIRLWHAIHENNIQGHKFRGFTILKSNQAETTTLAREVMRLKNTQDPICLVYSNTCLQSVDVKELMDMPAFASAIDRCDAALKAYNINLVIMITGNSVVSTDYLQLCITTAAIQIGLTDILASIDVKFDNCIGYGVGELACAYAKGMITAEEAMIKAYRQGLDFMEKSVNDNKNKNATFNVIFSMLQNVVVSDISPKLESLNGYAAKNGDCNGNHSVNMKKDKPTKDFFTNKSVNSSSSVDFSRTTEDLVPLIPTNAIILKVTPGQYHKNDIHINMTHLKNVIEICLIQENTICALKNLLIGIGRLYEAGLNMKISKLYPNVTFPVSQSTPMLSHLVKWNHRENWFRAAFLEDRVKLPAEERIITISMENPELDYLLGHQVGGRLLYPGSGYVVLVWEAFAKMHGFQYREFSVVFENIRFLRVTTIPKKGDLLFNITIHPASGDFEVTENKTAVVTGVIRAMNTHNKAINELPTLKQYKNSDEISLSRTDFYKEIKLRGYDHGGMFKGVIDCSIDGNYSRVSWNNNWVVFIDYILQHIVVSNDTRNLYIPTLFAKLSIDIDLHYKTLATNASATEEPYFEVFVDADAPVTRSGGLELRGFQGTMISQKTDLGIPIFEKYVFIPNFGKVSMIFEDIIRTYVDLIIENTQVYKFKAIEIVDEKQTWKGSQSVLKYVDKVLEFVPQVWVELNIVTNGKNIENRNKNTDMSLNITELNKMPEDKNAVLFVGPNLSQKEKILKESNSCLREGGFIISREEDVTSIKKLDKKFHIIAMNKNGDEVLVLLKKRTEEEKKIYLKIDAFDQSFLWISELKEAMETRNKIVLYANEDLNGIIGLVNCLRREPGGNNIQCLFVNDSNIPPFDPELQFYKCQLEKDLAFNIFKDGEWGTYRHVLLKNVDSIKPSLHSYVDIETIGDLSTIKWLEGGLKENIQEKNDNLFYAHVYSSALNFRDIVTATGRISVDSVARGRLAQEKIQGFEFAGKLLNGMRIAGMADQSISNVVLCDVNLMIFIPDEWTFEEAAGILVAYSTAYLSFDGLTKVKPGESVLIHTGSGAVGQAAINIALHRGYNVFTTVGTSEKRDFIKKLYPQLKDNRIGNSRDTSFEQMIMKETNGKGVDVIINSLTEDKLLASLRCLARGGRFLEIGKYDIFKNTQIETSFLKKEFSFHGVMLDYIFDKVSNGKQLMQHIVKGITKGEVRPVIHCTFEKNDVEAAYRYMASGRHIGKVIIKIRDEDEKSAKPKPMLIDGRSRYTCRKDYVYLLVGGLGGFGLELADWLVLRGARKLVLVSTKGVSNGYQARRIKILTSYGAEIRILKDDVTTESGCKKILDSALSMGHVEAIFNLAGVLNDALFQNQSPELFERTFKPKALATLHLDRLSRTMCPNLRDFVVFSSISCGRGNAGQSNYGLANSVMERICEQRRKHGLPGLAIQWGAIGDVGMLAELQAEIGEMDVGGTMPQRISSCLRSLDKLLIQKDAIVSTYVLAQKKLTDNDMKNAVETVAQIIGIKNLKTISHQVSLAELGMDSIMGLEVKQTLERDFDIVLAAQDIRTMTFAKLTAFAPERQDSCSKVKDTVNRESAKINDDWVFDLRYFLNNFGEEENAYKHIITMPTRYTTNNENMDVSANTLFMIPGLEGSASSLEPLCRHLNTKACVLQLPFNKTRDLQNMGEKLYKVMKPHMKRNSSFNLLGYSYGTVPLFALAAKLESDGHMGTVFCIDGSPTWIKSLFKNRITMANGNELQDNIVKYVLEATLPDGSSINKLLGKSNKLSNIDDKIDYIIEHSPLELRYSNEFIKKICKACNDRLQIVNDYDLSAITKIKSPVILLRTEHGVVRDFPENYELDKFTEHDVKVHFFKGSHVSILEDPNVATIIEKYLHA